MINITSPIYRIRSFVRLVQRGPVNGTIAGKRRHWSLGSLLFFIVIEFQAGSRTDSSFIQLTDFYDRFGAGNYNITVAGDFRY